MEGVANRIRKSVKTILAEMVNRIHPVHQSMKPSMPFILKRKVISPEFDFQRGGMGARRRGGKRRRPLPTLENLSFLLYRGPFCNFFTMRGPFCYFCLYVGDFFVPVGSHFGLPPLFCGRPLGD